MYTLHFTTICGPRSIEVVGISQGVWQGYIVTIEQLSIYLAIYIIFPRIHNRALLTILDHSPIPLRGPVWCH